MSLRGAGLLLAVMFLATALSAQTTTAKIQGTVRDESEGILPGVTITATNLETHLTRMAHTDSMGLYSLVGLPAGLYGIRTELSGFRSEVRSPTQLAVGQEMVLDVVMKVGEVTEQVTVTGEAPVINVTSATLAGLVDDKRIRDLPLNGRSFAELALLQTGVTRFSNTTVGPIGGRGVKMSVAGARISSNSWLLDGTDVNDGYNNTPGSVAGTLLGVETVREFQVNTANYSAQFGRSAGAVVNAITKSGTNAVHGAGWEFVRSSRFDAKNYFDPPNQSIPPFSRNQFGFTLGGPIKKDRTFYFGSYERLHENLSVSLVATVPNVDARAGRLPGGEIVQVNPAMKPFLDLYSAPNGRDFGDGTAEALFSQTQPTRENFIVSKVDHKLSDRDSFFARYTFDDGSVPRPLDFPIFVSAENSRNQYLTFEENKLLGPRWLNTFRFGLNSSRTDANFSLIDPRARISGSLPEAVPGRGRIPDIITLFGVSPFPHDDSRPFPALNHMYLFEWSDDADYNTGRHAIKFGGIVKRYHFNITQGLRLEGAYTFSTLRDLIEARSFNFQAASPDSDPVRAWRQTLFGFYIQDDFRVTDRFTLNLGFRYEFQVGPSEAHDKIWNLRHPLDPETTHGEPFFENPSLADFAPRVGFAWDPSGNRKTAVRGGFGLFYDQIMATYYLTTSFQTPLFRLSVAPRAPFPHPFEGSVQSIPILQPIEFNTLHTPFRVQYNLSIERELLPDTSVNIAYVGSLGRHLGRFRDINAVDPDILPDGSKFFPLGRSRPNPRFGSIGIKSTDGNSVYNALQLGFNLRLRQGVRVQVSYTWSRSIDDASGILRNDSDNNPQNALVKDDRTGDRGLSAFDVRHNFTGNFTWDLPHASGLAGPWARLVNGWQLSGIVTLNSGNPFTITNGFDQSRSKPGEAATDRPAANPRFAGDPIFGDPSQWFKPAAFQLQKPGTFGNLGRNTLIGPPLRSFDGVVVKNFDWGRDLRVQFRAEFFNLVNHPNFEAPNSRARTVFISADGRTNGGAGRLTRTVNSSRQIQFGFKFIF